MSGRITIFLIICYTLGMKLILMIIDMQKDFFEKEVLAEQSKVLIENINYLISEFREKNLPIIWIRQAMKADFSDAPLASKKSGKAVVVEGTEGYELLDGLNFREADYRVIKRRYSGFFGTNSEQILDKEKVDKLVVCGINTHACVRMTVIDAYQRDFEVIVARDGVASYDDEHHRITMRYFEPSIAKVMSNAEIIELLSG